MAPPKGSSAADTLGSATKRVSGAVANSAPTALKRAAGGAAGGATRGAAGAGRVAAAEGAALNAIGFTALGPAAGSHAAAWMSSIALANGVGVSAGSLYPTAQAAAMGSAARRCSEQCAICAVAGTIVMAVKLFMRGGSGDAPGPDGSRS
jgi:hypothetical protein